MKTDEIRQECREMNPRIVEWRRALHRIPELGIDLPETEGYVRGVLDELGAEYQPGYNGVGIVALVRGGAGDGPVVGIRADMDALEVEEPEGRPWRSTKPGRMHACGHDAHTAMALGAAALLCGDRGSFRGTVKFIFQPAEERMDGARRMLEAGAMDSPKVDILLGLHIGGLWDELGPGQVGLSEQPTMAAADAFDFSMSAPGGHGAAPHTTADPVLAAAEALTSLHTLVSRDVDPVDTAVITVGSLHGGSARNIIPTGVTAKGTVRTLREEVRGLLERRIGEVVGAVAAARGCGHEYSYYRGAPPVISDREAVELVSFCAEEVLGGSNVKRINRPSMAGEDVSILMEQATSCFFGLGGSDPDRGIRSSHHSPEFEIDESILWHGTAVFCASVLRTLAVDG